MRKGKRRRDSAPTPIAELDLSRLKTSIPKIELKRGIEFSVQLTTGQNAELGKVWICPVCAITIEPGLHHTVAWDLHRGVQTRRHFHNHCWKLFDGLLP
jgi:hypothetical protein